MFLKPWLKRVLYDETSSIWVAHFETRRGSLSDTRYGDVTYVKHLIITGRAPPTYPEDAKVGCYPSSESLTKVVPYPRRQQWSYRGLGTLTSGQWSMASD